MNKIEVLRAAYREGDEAAQEARDRGLPYHEAKAIFVEVGRRRRRYVEQVQVARQEGRRKSDST